MRFLPANSVPIDPATVRVFYRRDPPVDITQRIKQYITPNGIDAPGNAWPVPSVPMKGSTSAVGDRADAGNDKRQSTAAEKI